METATAILIGQRARAARERLGLLQAEVAERLDISVEVYGRFERGLVTPRIKTLLKLCRVLALRPNDLLLPDEPPPLPADAVDPRAVDLQRLVAVLADADPLTIRRLTEVARWLRSGEPPPAEPAPSAPASRAAEAGPTWGEPTPAPRGRGKGRGRRGR